VKRNFLLIVVMILITGIACYGITNMALKARARRYQTFRYYISCKGPNDYTNDFSIKDGVLYFVGRSTGERVVKSSYDITAVNRKFVVVQE